MWTFYHKNQRVKLIQLKCIICGSLRQKSLISSRGDCTPCPFISHCLLLSYKVLCNNYNNFSQIISFTACLLRLTIIHYSAAKHFPRSAYESQGQPPFLLQEHLLLLCKHNFPLAFNFLFVIKIFPSLLGNHIQFLL